MAKKFIHNIQMAPIFRFLIPIMLAALTGCKETYISVHTDYLSHENLASFIVKTPDPLLNNPPIGQRLIISWSVPPCYMDFDDIHLSITIRFRNNTQIVEEVPLTQRKGTFVYPVLNEDYFTTRGILTYKVDLLNNDNVLEAWRHQIWTEFITVESTETQKEDEVEECNAENPSDESVTTPENAPAPSNFYEDFE